LDGAFAFGFLASFSMLRFKRSMTFPPFGAGARRFLPYRSARLLLFEHLDYGDLVVVHQL
jgi:hypothetical protein